MLRRYVSRTLGAEPAVADLLLARVRAHHGASYGLRAVLFVLATVHPLTFVVPRRIRSRCIVGFVEPMLNATPAGLAYLTGRAAHLTEPCEGLLEP